MPGRLQAGEEHRVDGPFTIWMHYVPAHVPHEELRELVERDNPAVYGCTNIIHYKRGSFVPAGQPLPACGFVLFSSSPLPKVSLADSDLQLPDNICIACCMHTSRPEASGCRLLLSIPAT